MAEKSFPWTANGTGDGTSGGYTGLEWGEIWRRTFLAGLEASASVLRGHGSELAVSGTASPLTVGTGAGYVYGKHYYNDAALNLAVTTPTVGTTGGHVILRLDWAAQTVRCVVVRNTDGNSAIPALTQSTSTQWEVRLATFTITTGGVITLTDQRLSAAVGKAMPWVSNRQGGNASDWGGFDGTTNYAFGAGRMECGAAATAGVNGNVTVTLGRAFRGKPLIFVTPLNIGVILSVGVLSTSQFVVTARDAANNVQSTIFYWIAIGPE